MLKNYVAFSKTLSKAELELVQWSAEVKKLSFINITYLQLILTYSDNTLK